MTHRFLKWTAWCCLAGLVLLLVCLSQGWAAEIIVTPSGGDDTARINAALASTDWAHPTTGNSVRLDGTVFQVSSSIICPALQCKLHGNGRGQTALVAIANNFTVFTALFAGGSVPGIGRVELSDLSISDGGHGGLVGWDIEGYGDFHTVSFTFLTDVLVNQVSTYGMQTHGILRRTMNAQLMGDQMTGGADGLVTLDDGMLNIIAFQSYGLAGAAGDIEATPDPANHAGEGLTIDGFMVNGASGGLTIRNVGSIEATGVNISSVAGVALHLAGYANGGHIVGQLNAGSIGLLVDSPDPTLGGVSALDLLLHVYGTYYGELIQPGAAIGLRETGNFHDQAAGGADIVDAGCTRCVFESLILRSPAASYGYVEEGTAGGNTLRGLRSSAPIAYSDATTATLSAAGDNRSGL